MEDLAVEGGAAPRRSYTISFSIEVSACVAEQLEFTDAVGMDFECPAFGAMQLALEKALAQADPAEHWQMDELSIDSWEGSG